MRPFRGASQPRYRQTGVYQPGNKNKWVHACVLMRACWPRVYYQVETRAGGEYFVRTKLNEWVGTKKERTYTYVRTYE